MHGGSIYELGVLFTLFTAYAIAACGASSPHPSRPQQQRDHSHGFPQAWFVAQQASSADTENTKEGFTVIATNMCTTNMYARRALEMVALARGNNFIALHGGRALHWHGTA